MKFPRRDGACCEQFAGKNSTLPRARPYTSGKEQARALIGGVRPARRLKLEITGVRRACDGRCPERVWFLAVAENTRIEGPLNFMLLTAFAD